MYRKSLIGNVFSEWVSSLAGSRKLSNIDDDVLCSCIDSGNGLVCLGSYEYVVDGYTVLLFGSSCISKVGVQNKYSDGCHYVGYVSDIMFGFLVSSDIMYSDVLLFARMLYGLWLNANNRGEVLCFERLLYSHSNIYVCHELGGVGFNIDSFLRRYVDKMGVDDYVVFDNGEFSCIDGVYVDDSYNIVNESCFKLDGVIN